MRCGEWVVMWVCVECEWDVRCVWCVELLRYGDMNSFYDVFTVMRFIRCGV